MVTTASEERAAGRTLVPALLETPLISTRPSSTRLSMDESSSLADDRGGLADERFGLVQENAALALRIAVPLGERRAAMNDRDSLRGDGGGLGVASALLEMALIPTRPSSTQLSMDQSSSPADDGEGLADERFGLVQENAALALRIAVPLGERRAAMNGHDCLVGESGGQDPRACTSRDATDFDSFLEYAALDGRVVVTCGRERRSSRTRDFDSSRRT
jgi:hypothetical protein